MSAKVRSPSETLKIDVGRCEDEAGKIPGDPASGRTRQSIRSSASDSSGSSVSNDRKLDGREGLIRRVTLATSCRSFEQSLQCCAHEAGVSEQDQKRSDHCSYSN